MTVNSWNLSKKVKKLKQFDAMFNEIRAMTDTVTAFIKNNISF